MRLYVFVDTAERFPMSVCFETEAEAVEWARETWQHIDMPDVELVQVGEDDD